MGWRTCSTDVTQLRQPKVARSARSSSSSSPWSSVSWRGIEGQSTARTSCGYSSMLALPIRSEWQCEAVTNALSK
eukprot:1824917-Prymnesium_polylepis.2